MGSIMGVIGFKVPGSVSMGKEILAFFVSFEQFLAPCRLHDSGARHRNV